MTGTKKGTVTGVDLTGATAVYIDGKKYELSQVMGIGEVPVKIPDKDKDETDKTDTDKTDTDKTDTDNTTGDKDKE